MTVAHKCYDAATIADLADLASDSPERQAAEACPNCRALLREYAAFMEAEAAPGSIPKAADDHLEVFIAEQFGGEQTEPAPQSRRGGLSRFRRRLIPAIAAVFVALVVVVWTAWQQDDLPVTRSGGDDATFELHAPTVYDQHVQLSWEPTPHATAYTVVIYQADLTALKEVGPLPETHTIVLRRDLPDMVGVSLAWRVFAFNSGDEIAASEIGYITFSK